LLNSESGRFTPGQRWISVTEPELGLGVVRSVGPRTVTLWFPGTRESRQYVVGADAPIRRAAWRAGDSISTGTHGALVVDHVIERDGLLYYVAAGSEVSEAELSHTLSFSSPLERLFAAQFDASEVFELRLVALTHQHRRRQSEVRGFVGGRIDLLPHQLGIASEVTGRLIPRVLLADEAGLGKTIEACLIVHRLLLTGRAGRVLIVTPETLVHQWFLELLRRFNLWFHIYTEARCVAIEESDAGVNPFLDDQLVLCDLGLFTANPVRLEQAVAAGWDVVVVDEAHHLAWTPDGASPEYDAIERLGRVSPGLLLLTATPEQLGIPGHFARLRLLDPGRFHDFDQFARESDSYRVIARLAAQLIDGRPVGADDRQVLAGILGEDAVAVSAALESGASDVRRRWVERLMDQHGTGRVMFRNTRATIKGFPARIAHLHELAVSTPTRFKALADEWAEDSGQKTADGHLSLAHDLRIDWLVALLQTPGIGKVLLICTTPRKAMAIESALRLRTTIPFGAFHERITLLQRDRAAAWFAEPDGARLLVCSEIGSEGRNFQFAHHLVLFDLPIDPSLLEQRLGRLDRIGQREDIHVHVPVLPGTHLEVLARWYQEGLNAIEQHVPGSREMLARFEPELRDLIGRTHKDRKTVAGSLDAFIDRVRAARAEVVQRLEEGRDRLLEWNSLRPALSTRIVQTIRDDDGDRTLDEFMLSVFDLFVIEVEEVSPRTWRLGSAGVLVDNFPGLRAEGLACTRERTTALQREDLQFLTWDHPLATGALDMLLGSERGNCGYARWIDPAVSALYLDTVYVLECVAPPALHADRFLAPTPVRILVDHRGREAAQAIDSTAFEPHTRPAVGRSLLARADIRDTLLPTLLERTRTLADARTTPLIAESQATMRAHLERETTRLRELQKVNRTVSHEEIERLADEQRQLASAIGKARLRLDAVRVIHRGPHR
jgi:ATP-dependent helicase HepA